MQTVSNVQTAVWNNMRLVAMERYRRGEMPGWFDPAWLDKEEAPENEFWRQQGLQHWQVRRSAGTQCGVCMACI